jgi:hypothetical protein
MWQCLAIAVEEEAEDVGHLIGDKNMPCLYNTCG